MKKTIAAILVFCFLTGCSDSRPVLHIYNWADYMSPKVLKRFEEKFNCRIVLDTFESNEAMYAKLKAGARGYDVIFPTSYMAEVMKKQNMLQPLKRELIPNIADLDPVYLKMTLDPEVKYGVPYMVSVAGIGYNKTRLGQLDATWGILTKPEVKRRCTLLNDMREAIGAALKSLGYSLNTTNEKELAEAQKVLVEWKKNIAKFEVEEALRGLSSGEFLLVHGYNGDILQAMNDNKDLDFVIPKEGTTIACDNMVIPVGAKQIELAHAFINFMHEPANCAENMELLFYFSPNVKAKNLVNEKLRNNKAIFLEPEILAKSEILHDLGDDNQKYIRVWDKVKAAE